MGSRLERAFITAKSFLEEDLSRKEAADILGKSRTWTYGAYEAVSEALEEDLSQIEDKGRQRVIREIQEWFEKDDRKERFLNRIKKDGAGKCKRCGRFYPKRESPHELCDQCLKWAEKQSELSF